MANTVWTDHVKQFSNDSFDFINNNSSVIFTYEKDHDSNVADDFAIYYDYTKGDETSIVFSYQVYEEDFELDFSVPDSAGNDSITITATGKGRIIVPASNLDDKFKFKVQYGDGSSTGVGTLAGRGVIKLGIEPITEW